MFFHIMSHSVRVSLLGYMIARGCNLPVLNSLGVCFYGLLHDIGKFKIPKEIINKPGPLTTAEYEIVKHHAALGAAMLKRVNIKPFHKAARVALEHHERWDGSGYNGLKTDQPLIESRIIALADVYDALTHRRVYKLAHTKQKAMEYLCKKSCNSFDPAVLKSFCRLNCEKAITNPRERYEKQSASRPRIQEENR